MDTDKLLLYLAEKGAMRKEAELSTVQIATELGISQQSVSRKLMELEEEKLITRTASTR
jgi:CTP-dependent riboflavin kinase